MIDQGRRRVLHVQDEFEQDMTEKSDFISCSEVTYCRGLLSCAFKCTFQACGANYKTVSLHKVSHSIRASE